MSPITAALLVLVVVSYVVAIYSINRVQEEAEEPSEPREFIITRVDPWGTLRARTTRGNAGGVLELDERYVGEQVKTGLAP